MHVRSPQLQPRALVEALDRADFYAFTGVGADDYASMKATTVTVKSDNAGVKIGFRVHRQKRDGCCGKVTEAQQVTHQFNGDEGHARARVLESNGRRAWIQRTMCHSGGRKPTSS